MLSHKMDCNCYANRDGFRKSSHIYSNIYNKCLSHVYFTALPNITTQPVSMTIREGDLNVIAVSCLAIGIGSLNYQWEKYHFFNNSWISPSHRAVSVMSSDLKFDVITEEDEGVYRCVVNSNDGSVISDNATVRVYGE